MPILDTLVCGFAKAFSFEYLTRNPFKNQNVAATKKTKSSNLKKTYKGLQWLFKTNYFKIDRTTLCNKYPSICDQIHSIGKQTPNVKELVLKTFPKREWSLSS